MRWDEQAAVRADERRAMEARVLDVVDGLAEAHDGDWAMENALEIIRLRFTALFAADEEEDG